jgi:trans-aconitate 2-methyltransferase
VPWNPAQYLVFGEERLRPALDLLHRIPLEAPANVLDLGCGTGNVARLLADRWPKAAITGVDTSQEMLEKARQAVPGATWVEADLRSWAPSSPADLVFSNAALHWLDDHGALFPRIAAWVKPGGVLAVQMPASHGLPSHTAAFDLAAAAPWKERIPAAVKPPPVPELEAYHAWLAPHARSLDLWETTYLHVLVGDDPVTEWFKGSLLVPYLEALPAEHHAAFLEAYRRKVLAAYPKGAAGRTLMPFRRVFLVATF